MKKQRHITAPLLSLCLLATLLAAPVLAADVYTYEGKGTVTFNHKGHGAVLDCSRCHEGEPGRIPIENKQQGHDLCLNCHKTEKAAGNAQAPVTCSACHVQ
ncbi:cytochrome c3 family protein [Desulfuromonas thiophila]|uniref:Doubled CXXCH domain-containing protein n=1 Tax=Desulfuromonas thiophila TaxID=57664 RepID=A0A1G7DR61_9BACT|nr:cytochrome c3 family protein [Desulfuromonas thiophila]SDE53991.1 doubled CXXCH domain-containing protein [Desulfuromonas thiophila]